MRLISARLKGLIGVYRASGKREIFIDFSKCKNRLTLIIGKNGSGKSTIWNALQPLPDPLSNLVPKMECEKELIYELDDNTRYTIKITYPVNTLGDRTKTNAYITKTVNGVETELNPNGNIGSYKDILFSEFKLDPNFVQLSQLSSDNKGMAGKTPSERKKYVNSILDNVEIYNNIGKVLSKRASNFKAMINSIVAKIDNIGNEDSLNSFLLGAENRLSRLEAEEKSLTKSLSDLEASIKVIDPDGSIQGKYNSIYSLFLSLSQEIKINDNTIVSIKNDGFNSLDESLLLYTTLSQDIANLDKEIFSIQNELSNLLLTREEESKIIQIKSNKLLVLKSDIDYDSLQSSIQVLRENIRQYKEIFKSIGIDNYSSISKDEFITGITLLNNIKESILTIKSSINLEDLNRAITYILNGDNVVTIYNESKGELDSLNEEINRISIDINRYNDICKRISILKDRPKNCKNDSCVFIADAVRESKNNPEKILSDLEVKYNSLLSKQKVLIKNVNDLQNILDIYNQLLLIKRYIETNAPILSKLPNCGKYTDINNFFSLLLNGYSFNDIDSLYSYIDRANTFELYSSDVELLHKYETDMTIYESKQEVINEIQIEINELTKKLSNITQNVENTNKKIAEKSIQLEDLKLRQSKCSKAIDAYKLSMDLHEKKKDLKSQLDSILSDMSVIEKYIQDINTITTQLDNISAEKKTVNDDIYKSKFSLQQLKEYNEELEQYKVKYERTEIIRKYSTPTKDGIQTVFMMLYMGKTLSMANELLSLFFNGELELGEPNIDATEFTIPCKSNVSSVVNDDISSCSGGEKAMIDMILSFTFLHQSSTMYNILRLDEIDAPLDQNNRASFIIALNKIMNIFDVQNCIMISHSSEIELKDVDIILLNPVDNNLPSGNIIFSYNDN